MPARAAHAPSPSPHAFARCRRARNPARLCRRSSRLYESGKVVPSKPEVHLWALLALLGPGQVQLGPGHRGGLTRVREWVAAVLQQREQYEQAVLFFCHVACLGVRSGASAVDLATPVRLQGGAEGWQGY